VLVGTGLNTGVVTLSSIAILTFVTCVGVSKTLKILSDESQIVRNRPGTYSIRNDTGGVALPCKVPFHPPECSFLTASLCSGCIGPVVHCAFAYLYVVPEHLCRIPSTYTYFRDCKLHCGSCLPASAELPFRWRGYERRQSLLPICVHTIHLHVFSVAGLSRVNIIIITYYRQVRGRW
jgi:hypothetical protein